MTTFIANLMHATMRHCGALYLHFWTARCSRMVSNAGTKYPKIVFGT